MIPILAKYQKEEEKVESSPAKSPPKSSVKAKKGTKAQQIS